ILNPEQAISAVKYFDKWSRFIQHEERYRTAFDRLVSIIDAPPAVALLIREYFGQIEWEATKLLQIASELRLKAISLCEQCLSTHGLRCSDDKVSQWSAGRWMDFSSLISEKNR